LKPSCGRISRASRPASSSAWFQRRTPFAVGHVLVAQVEVERAEHRDGLGPDRAVLDVVHLPGVVEQLVVVLAPGLHPAALEP
jgi:hypothetical protein